MAHTRWATHGSKTDANAHPHTDASGTIALVHNGTLNNAHELRRRLHAEHPEIQLQGQTDSEVLAKWIGVHYYAQQELTKNLKQAVQTALADCDGTWGLVVASRDAPHQLVVTAHGSPLCIGLGDAHTYVASEPSAFAMHTQNFIRLDDDEWAVLDAHEPLQLDTTRQELHAPVTYRPQEYPHWSLQEIMEQPQACGRALAFGGRLGFDKVHLGGFDDALERLQHVQHLLLCACGTSLHAARYGELLLKWLNAVESVQSMDASETQEKDFPCPHQDTAVLVVSQSGETKDVLNVVHQARASGVTSFSVVNAVGSTIARTTKLGVYVNAGLENAVASTKAFSSQVTVLALIALWFRQLRGTLQPPEATSLKEALMRLPLSFGSALKTRDQCRALAQELKDKEHCFVLGKGFGEPVALEGALKIKEFSYMHAEGYSGGALKHGPFALIEGADGKFGATPVIMLILDDKHAHHMRTAAEEVKARGARVIVITDNSRLADGLDETPIVIPPNGPLTALGAVVPLQLLAYELAVLRGINPDTPRNLAKAVLVD